MASLRRTLAFMKWAAKEAKNDLDPLARGTRGANRVMARRSREFVDSILRTTGEDFDSSGDDVSNFKCAPPTRQTTTPPYTADPITLLEHTLT
jgi:hypothetical protein